VKVENQKNNKNEDRPPKAEKDAPAMKGRDFISQFSGEGKEDGRLDDSTASGIPEFDLANQIMAQHRRQTAGKRKAPGKTVEPLLRENKNYNARQRFTKMQVPNNEIIREIVKRDIEKLCRGEKVEY